MRSLIHRFVYKRKYRWTLLICLLWTIIRAKVFRRESFPQHIHQELKDEQLPTVALPVNDTYEALWGKTQSALKYIYDHHLDDADWFFKADDDTFVVVENLKFYISSLDDSLPLYLGGRRRRDGNTYGYIEGGSGYLMTKATIRLFVEYAFKSDFVMCESGQLGPEDVNLGKCLEKVGAKFGDTRDSLGRERFLQYSMKELLHPNVWLENTNFYPINKGLNCCSDTAISFHKTPDQHLLEFQHLIYRLEKPANLFK